MPTFANGKICYIEIPATDIPRSAEFYSRGQRGSDRKRCRRERRRDRATDWGGRAPEITARFRDPAGNLIGLYEPA